MARMIPKQCPPETASAAERHLFTALEKGLDSTYTVIHSLPWLDRSRRFLQEGECDFLLLHPDKGLLAIETKTGEPRYDGPTKNWLNERGKRIDDPFLQAQSSAHVLDRLLQERVQAWKKTRPRIAHAVVFPHAEKTIGSFPLHVTPEILLLRPDLDRIQAHVERILTERAGTPHALLSPEAFQDVVRHLLPIFQVASTLSLQLEDQQAGLVRLTRSQSEVLRYVTRNRRLIVQGCAGSGKTMLAMEAAVRMRQEGARVLFLCFNIPLASEVQRSLQARGAKGIDVFYFHALCTQVLRETGRTFKAPENATQEFWDTVPPSLLDEVVGSTSRRYDAILVDEGQDFAGLWWIPIEKLLADAARGYLYIFLDPNQNIFNRDQGLPFTEPIVHLPFNCRNTVQIARLVHKLGNIQAESPEFAVEGRPPVLREVRTDDEEREEIRKLLHELVQNQGLQSRQITLLGFHRFPHSLFARQPELGRFRIIDSVSPGGHGEVNYATLYRFKGLEADCVIVTGVGADSDRPGQPVGRRHLYVTCSRARLLLTVFHRPGALQSLL
ncbi:MAG: NERD domain-containing protein [Planctomycetes bacterium]|nr:NERD domain-containing protein [Planctomycetota bacterium]